VRTTSGGWTVLNLGGASAWGLNALAPLWAEFSRCDQAAAAVKSASTLLSNACATFDASGLW
jgi:hypothetical protein